MKIDKEKIILIIMGLILVSLVLQVGLYIKPFTLLRETRNTTRMNHLKLIVDTVYFYYTKYDKFPDCIPESGAPVAITECSELKDYVNKFPQDPDPKYIYLIEYANKEKNKIRVYSTAPESKGIEIVR